MVMGDAPAAVEVPEGGCPAKVDSPEDASQSPESSVLSSLASSLASDNPPPSDSCSPRSPAGHGPAFAAFRRSGSHPVSEIRRADSPPSSGAGASRSGGPPSMANVSSRPALAIDPRLARLERPLCEPTSPGSAGPALPRQCSHKLWQPDSAAQVCSMSTCSNEFSNSSYIPGLSSAARRRHHCRQCGRVVCSDCSKGTKLMLPAHTKSGPAKNVRVCNACLHGGETFNFRSNPRVGQAGLMQAMLSSSRSSSPMVRRAISRRGSDLAADMIAAVEKVMIKTSASSPSLVALEHATSPSVMEAALQRPQLSPDERLASGDTMESLRGPDSQLSCADTPEGITPQGKPPHEVRYPDDKAVSDAYRAKDQAATASAAEERVRRLEKELEASSYYQGLKQYEPAALKALTGALGGLA